MGPWYYEVVSFDGDYVNLRRTDIASDELNPVALALLPPELQAGYRPLLLDYLHAGKNGQTPHTLRAAYEFHNAFNETGDMRNADFSKYL